MDPETHSPPQDRAVSSDLTKDPEPLGHSVSGQRTPAHRDVTWVLFGDQGLRVGWCALAFWGLYELLIRFLGTLLVAIYPEVLRSEFSPRIAVIGELVRLLAVLAAVLVMARLENRRLLNYNLVDRRRFQRLSVGFLFGFVALSALVCSMALGGWLSFGKVGLTGTHILRAAVVWGIAFLLTGFIEEGAFRCYLQFTLSRGINFWWALGTVSVVCLYLGWSGDRNGVVGVYLAAAIGLVPCFLLYLRQPSGSGFWQAAWVTSTLFGTWHTGNNGENWIGIFAAASIGFVFCVSVKVTGSAWWAIGCHMGWDWSETYFYGTADSGFVAKGHYLTTAVSGNPLWSGGADGPEGSLLVIGICLLLLAALMVVYGRRKPAPLAISATEQLAGS